MDSCFAELFLFPLNKGNTVDTDVLMLDLLS